MCQLLQLLRLPAATCGYLQLPAATCGYLQQLLLLLFYLGAAANNANTAAVAANAAANPSMMLSSIPRTFPESALLLLCQLKNCLMIFMSNFSHKIFQSGLSLLL
jgi:hypothetical protein